MDVVCGGLDNILMVSMLSGQHMNGIYGVWTVF